jgi:hypothetical protein
VKQKITEFFFSSEDDFGDFSYNTYKFGGLRFFLELAIFLAVKLGVENPKSCISFFRLCRRFLENIDGLRAYNGYKYSGACMINFLLFVRLCRFKKRESALEFLEKHKGWGIAIGFYNGVPHESDITKFINKIGAALDVYFVHLLKFIRENISIAGIKAFHIIGFLQRNHRFGVRIRTGAGTKFTRYSQRKKQASTHWAGMTLILDALYGLGIINMIENIPAKKKIRGYPMLQISLTLIVKMITGLEDLHELENEVEEDPLLAMFCTIESDDTPSIPTLSRDVERYSVTELRESHKLILQWLKELKLIDGSVASVDSSKIYTGGKVQEGIAEVYDYLKKEKKKGYKIFVVYDPICGILIDFTLLPINKSDNPNLIPLLKRARDILGKSTLKKVYFDRGFYDGEHFDWLNKNHILFVCRGKQNTKVADQVSEIPVEEYVEEKIAPPKEYQPKTVRGKRAKEKRDAMKEPVEIAERMVDVSNCEEKLRAIAVKEKGKKSMEIWLTNIPASVCSAKGIIDEYRNRWCVEVFFKEEKSYWYLDKLPSRKLNAVKCTIYFNFIAYNLISIFKKTLSEKYQNVGIKVLRREVLRKNAIIYFNEDGFELEFNAKKAKAGYHGQIASINSFVKKMRGKIEVQDIASLSHTKHPETAKRFD